MKLWHKIFICTLILFTIAFDVGSYVLVSYSYNFSLKSEKDSSVREETVILSSIESGIANADRLFTDTSTNVERLRAVITPFAKYYENLGVSLQLFNGDTLVFSNGPAVPKELLSVQVGNKNILEQKTNDKKYLHVASKIPNYTNLTVVYTRDISQLTAFRLDIINVFIVVNTVVCMFLGLFIFLVLKRLTRPIHDLNETTKEIANGAYNKRVNIHRNDELGELGNTFNIMADSVEDKVDQLIKSSADKQQFIDNLAHEMKTPLTSILGFSEYLQQATSNEEDRMKAAGHLHDSAKRLQNLSMKLLDLTYLRNQSLELTKIPVFSLLATLENLMQPSFSERNLSLETSAEIEYITADESLLVLLLTNLLENAARASATGQVVKMRAYQDSYLTIEVTDSGCGIKEQELNNITEPFYRVDKSRSREFGGVGLGLSLCKQIADAHGAQLQIKSQKGVGTSVQIVFTCP